MNMTLLSRPSRALLLGLALLVPSAVACGADALGDGADQGEGSPASSTPALLDPPTGIATQALTDPPGQWTAHVAGTCGDGTPAVYGVNPAPNPTGCLFVSGRGQGICDAASGTLACPPASGSNTTLHYTAADLASDSGQLLTTGLYDRAGMVSGAVSPFASCDFVIMPTCTGDTWLGAADRSYVINGSTVVVHHQGEALFSAQLAQIAATFPVPNRVIVYGFSSAGIGAMVHAGDFRGAWPTSVPMAMINDSGTLPRDPYLTGALQTQLLTQWGSPPLPAGCPACATQQGQIDSGLWNILPYANGIMPTAWVDSVGDFVISLGFATYPGDLTLRCANSAPYNALGQCDFGLTTRSPRAAPASFDLAATVSAAGIPTYLAKSGQACTGCPAGFGRWWTAHGLATGLNAIPAGGGPVAQSGCPVVQWAGAFALGKAQVPPCAVNVR